MREPRRTQEADGPVARQQPQDRRPKQALEPVPWYTQPRGYVWLVIALALVAGGGRKFFQTVRARRALRRLEEGTATPADIEALADHGRQALPELLGLLDPSQPETKRTAAGRALLRLWAKDELIAEEEKGVATRLYVVDWKARRRYPGSLNAPIRFQVTFGLSGMEPDGVGIKTSQLEWQWRIRGAPRASLEQFSNWSAVSSPAQFEIDPADLTEKNEQAIAFQARVRTTPSLTSNWELDLPQVPFRFELDRNLEVNSILSGADSETAATLDAGVRLQLLQPDEGSTTTADYTPIDPSFALVGRPILVLGKLPVDLAHRSTLQIQAPALELQAGICVISATRTIEEVPMSIQPGTEAILQQPGSYQVRLVLTPDPHLGWAHHDIRAVWPEQIVGPWQEVRIVRR